MITFLASSEAFKIIITTNTEVLVVLNTYKDYSSTMFCRQVMKNIPVAKVMLSRHLTGEKQIWQEMQKKVWENYIELNKKQSQYSSIL